MRGVKFTVTTQEGKNGTHIFISEFNFILEFPFLQMGGNSQYRHLQETQSLSIKQRILAKYLINLRFILNSKFIFISGLFFPFKKLFLYFPWMASGFNQHLWE